MSSGRGLWATAVPPEDELPAVVHGPVVLARGTGPGELTVGLRCVFAHPSGLRLPVVVLALDVHAEAAWRQHGYGGRGRDRTGPGGAGPGGAGPGGDPIETSTLSLHAIINGRECRLDPHEEQSQSSLDRYQQESQYWIGELPDDDRLGLRLAWPQVGLPPAVAHLRLPGVRRLAAAAVPLLRAGECEDRPES